MPSLTTLAYQPHDPIDGPERFKSYAEAFKWAEEQTVLRLYTIRMAKSNERKSSSDMVYTFRCSKHRKRK